MKSLILSKAIQCELLTDDWDKLEKIKNKEKYKMLLEKIFDHSAEIDALTPRLRRDLASSLKGHNNSKCLDMCEHLQRALMIKFKAKGNPYPVKIINV